MPTPLFGQDHQQVTEPDSDISSWTWRQRLAATARTTWAWWRQRAEVAADWARDQPPHRIGLGLAVAVGAVALLLWWLSPQQAAPPQIGDDASPRWLVEIQHVALWDRLASAVSGYAAQHATAAGMPSWLLLMLWFGIGASLLVTSWLSSRSRFAVSTLAFWIWLAATTWVIATGTPGSSPVPAALAAVLGLALSAAPWTAIPISALVLLGIAA